MKTLLVLSVVALSAALAQAAKRTEYVGLAPAGLKNQPGPGSPLIKWAALTYDGTETQASAVGWEMLTAAAPELGAWYNLDLSVGGGSGAALSAKTIGDKLYVYVDKTATGQGGCCADTFRTYDRATGKATEVDLSAMMKAVFPPEVAFHEATHTFDVEQEGDDVIAYLMVQYTDLSLGNVLANAVVAFNTADGSVVKTADGQQYFSFVEHLGTTSTAPGDGVYKIQFQNSTGGGEQWHGNGMLSFTNKAGERLLAFTHRMNAEAVVLTHPYFVAKAQGGGAIRQRFGTPKIHAGGGSDDDEASASASAYHYFGVPSTTAAWSGGVHNVHYRVSTSAALEGRETLSLFVNSVVGGSSSFAYEFALNLTKPQSRDGNGDGNGRAAHAYDDSVFDTAFVSAPCGFQAMAQGGARAIADGVFVTASGVGSGGIMEVVDGTGAKQDLAYGGSNVNLYDPFLVVQASA